MCEHIRLPLFVYREREREREGSVLSHPLSMCPKYSIAMWKVTNGTKDAAKTYYPNRVTFDIYRLCKRCGTIMGGLCVPNMWMLKRPTNCSCQSHDGIVVAIDLLLLLGRDRLRSLFEWNYVILTDSGTDRLPSRWVCVTVYNRAHWLLLLVSRCIRSTNFNWKREMKLMSSSPSLEGQSLRVGGGNESTFRTIPRG